MRIYTGFDAHRLTKKGELFIGGVKISTRLGVDAHSDGDVLLHSIVDAILSKKGLTIGQRFPEVYEYKNISSIELLKLAYMETKIRIKQIDSIIFFDKLPIIDRIPEMKKVLSSIVKIAEKNISIKPKNASGLFEGYVVALSLVVC